METEELAKEIVEMQPHLKYYAYSLTLDKEKADDLLQETTLKALYKLHTFKEKKNFKGWTFTIMYRTFINAHKRNNFERELIGKIQETNFTAGDGADTQTIVNHYDIGRIYDAISRLPDSCRSMFRMHIAGYRYNEIAELHRVPLSTVKNHIHASRLLLQKELKEFRL